ncbi:MAG TPA: hypothetical protein PKY12_01550 [Catalimonadaceae bacterium]|nr:hypothetical protein [Catalimonadaceae bacterium]
MIIKPCRTWELIRSADGKIHTVLRDNVTGSVLSYSVTEFQRGDVVEFAKKRDLNVEKRISKGDSIGFLFSNEEQLKLIELEGNLKVLKSEYLFFTTGQKPEDIEKSRRELGLAKQQLETQRKLMIRSEKLYRDSVLPIQQFELDQNELQVKEIAFSIAEARYQSAITGEKKEQSAMIKSKIDAIALQIGQIRKRINYFTILSPIDGVLAIDHIPPIENAESECLLRIYDNSKMVGIAPIRLSEKPFFEIGNHVFLSSENKSGQIISFDNVVKENWIESSVFLTALIADGHNLEPGKMTLVKATGKELDLKEYVLAMFQRR